MINFLFYTTEPQKFAEEITHIHSLSVLHSIELFIVCNSAKLMSSVSVLPKEKTIAILIASTAKELEDLILLQQQFSSISTILVLPDDLTETLQMGMLLSPIYFMTIQDNFSHFASATRDISNIYVEHFDPQPQYSKAYLSPAAP